MVLSQTRSLSLVLLFFVLPLVTPSSLCSNIAHTSHTDNLEACNEETELAGIEEVGIVLTGSQEKIDDLFKKKETLRNIALGCDFGKCEFIDFMMNNLRKADNCTIQLFHTHMNSFVISSPHSVLNFNYIHVSFNPNLAKVEIARIGKVQMFILSGNTNLKDLPLRIVENSSVDTVFDQVIIRGNHNLGPEYLQIFEDRKKSDWNIQPPFECLNADIMEGRIPLRECKYIYDDMEFNATTGTLGSQSLAEFTIKAIDGSLTIKNSTLESIGFLIGTSIKSASYIENNEKLCDYMDVVDNYPEDNAELIVNNNCKRCEITGPQENFDILSKCDMVIIGNLTFARKVTGRSPSFTLKWIDEYGSYINRFLKGTKTRRGCKNIIKNNIFLCDTQDLRDNYPRDNSSLIFEDNCHGVCQTFNQPVTNFQNLSQCAQVLYGDLMFATKVAPMETPFRLQKIKGCIYIEKSHITNVSFLIGTRTNDGCQNKISNNPFLCDFMDVVNNYPGKIDSLDYADNCHECQTYNRPLTNFRKLSHCEKHVYGDVIFKGNVEPMPRWIYLDRIYGCFVIEDTDLKTAKFLIGTRTNRECVNVVKNNKYLCDLAEVLDNIPEGTYIEAQNNCEKVCYDASEVWDKDCEVLHTISDVPISYVKQSKTLKRVHGPIKITSLKTETVDPSVLPQIEYDELVFRGNEFLCDEEAVRKLIPKGKKVSFKQNCWKRCPYPQILYGRKCTVFTGILDHRIFDNIELFERVLQKLEGVEGQIKIFGSNAQNLNFRKLKYVKNDNLPGPAILIENNKILKTVFLENLESVTSKTEPRIRIKNNGDFKFQEKDWKRIRNQTKTRLHKSLVVDIHRTKTKAPEKCSKDEDSSFKVVTPQKGILYWGALTLLFVLCIVIIVIFGLFCWFCYKVESGNY